jgi:hypothetical protein
MTATTIRTVLYEMNTRILLVKFASGAVHLYPDMPPAAFLTLRNRRLER